ncbi:hypothetical protein LNQ03_31230 [Klebsiella pneumoniae subsp. pneumoniae]|nr:hypothetical protein [Klebsiella pneumoniae subsp. pneumoniae]
MRLAFRCLLRCCRFAWLIPEPYTPSGDERPRRGAGPGDGRLLRRVPTGLGAESCWLLASAPVLPGAGRRGCCRSLATRVGPELGQGYIIRLVSGVVVLGGVVPAGPAARGGDALGWAFSSKILETRKWAAHCWAGILITGDDYSCFIKKRPQGSVRAPLKGEGY